MSVKKESGSTEGKAPQTNIHQMLALADIARELIRESKAALESDQPPNTELSEQSCLYIKEMAERFEVW